MDSEQTLNESPWKKRERLNQEWLAGLKVGDKVCYDGSGFFGTTTIDTVQSITPTRILKLKSGLQFNANGRVRGDHQVTFLFPYTQEVQDKVRHKKLVWMLGQVKWEKRNLLELEDVAATLRLE